MNTVDDKLEYFDLAYSTEPASYYYLILEIDTDYVRVMWYHLSKNLITGFAQYPFDKESGITQVLSSHKLLNSEYKEVIVSFRTGNYSISPRMLVDGSAKSTFELTNVFDESTDRIEKYALIGMPADLNYAIPEDLLNDIKSSFNHVKVIPHVGPSIEHDLSLARQTDRQNFGSISIFDDQLDIRMYKDGKLHLANSFYQCSKEDIAYYVLYAAEVIGLDQEQDVLEIEGLIAEGDETWNLLSTYWSHLRPKASFQNAELSSALPIQETKAFIPLTYGLLCVS